MKIKVNKKNYIRKNIMQIHNRLMLNSGIINFYVLFLHEF
jgi:hypothetical protein